MFAVQEPLEVAVRHLGHKVDAPVGQLAEQLLGHVAAGVDVGIAQTGQYLVLAVEWHPAPVALDLRQISLVERFPRVVDGLSADEAVETLGVLVVLVLTVFHDTQHVVQTLLQTGALGLVMAGGVCQRQC